MDRSKMESQHTFNWRKWCFYLTLAAILLFIGMLHFSMTVYNGGTIHEPELDQYSFTNNFISDLGRHRTPDGESNYPANLIFRSAMTLTGACFFLFFLALPGVFKSEHVKNIALIASVLGLVAGISYIGIAWVPYDLSYRGHRVFVRIGFISFLLMGLFFAAAILMEKNYPRKYGFVLILFCLVLFSQILLMYLGERSWRTPEALFRQATAQKVVVYSEVFCMLYQTLGALKYLRNQNPVGY